MEEEIQIFLDMSLEIERVLADNKIDLVGYMTSQGLAVQRIFASDPTEKSNTGHKDATTVILASAGLVLAITPLLSRIIETISRKPVVVEEDELRPIEDSSGKIVRDGAGKPVLQWATRARILQPAEAKRDETKVSLKGPVRLAFDFTSKVER